MRLFGIGKPKHVEQKAAVGVADSRGWARILESFSGAWQANVVVDRDLVLSYHAVYSCITLIASDIAKLRVKLVQQDGDGIWSEATNAAYSPVLRRPNPMQNRIQFWESWILSKLLRGNTYILKARDARGVVNRLYILDPTRVTPLVATDGSVFYQLQNDNLSGIQTDVVVPAREIIHDRYNCLFHPLVGVSPIFANGLAATQGIRIQNNSAWFFGNKSMPGGVLTAPGSIGEDTAARLKTHWDTSYGGENAGKVAVLGDGLTFQPIAIAASDAQLIEQLKWTAEVVCSTFHVPTYKVGIGTMPTYSNIQSLNVEYYSQCLQTFIEAAELCLDEGLEMASGIGTEFDLDGLLRMDSVTQMTVLKEAIGASVMAPNEARKKIDLKPVPGGNSPMAQEQNFSLAALAKRDALADPWASRSTEPAPTPAPVEDPAKAIDPADTALFMRATLRKELGLAA
jgi:HK97 family phage portal protein